MPASAMAAGFPQPEAFTPLFPVLLFAVLANTTLRRLRFTPRPRPAARRMESREDTCYDLPEWQLDNTEFCPICRAEYLSGTERCEDCAVPLVDEDDLPTADMPIEESVVRIARIRSSAQGHLVRSFFSSNRIPCTLARCSPCDVFGTDVYVFESDAVRAKRMLRSLFRDLEHTSF
jgi:hypothetical protein